MCTTRPWNFGSLDVQVQWSIYTARWCISELVQASQLEALRRGHYGVASTPGVASASSTVAMSYRETFVARGLAEVHRTLRKQLDGEGGLHVPGDR